MSGDCVMAWSDRFEEPLVCPDGTNLVTLRQAARFILKLPQAEHGAREWRTVMRLLIEAADHGGPITLARAAMMKAIYRDELKDFDPSQATGPSRRLANRRGAKIPALFLSLLARKLHTGVDQT
jgi:hypothetical protein